MGEIDENTAKSSLSGLAVIFKDLLPRLHNLGKYEIRVLILSIAQYLYCKYYTFGKYYTNKKGVSVYNIDVNTMDRIYNDETLKQAARRLIITRNKIGHDINSEETNNYIRILSNSKSFTKLLVYEHLLDEYGQYIEPEGGEYSLYELRPDIKFDIDPQKLADKMMKGASFSRAVDTMSGDN